jgi:uncharacterized protein (TIGR02145 family)
MKIFSIIFAFTFISAQTFSQNPCPGTPTVEYAGKTYNTVQIGSQCWLKENLDVGTMIPGSLEQKNNGTIEKYCYNDSIENCTTYGGLYQWAEAMEYAKKNRETRNMSKWLAYTYANRYQKTIGIGT